MSKASEWAGEFERIKGVRPGRMPVIDEQGSPLGAGVTDDGRAVITHGGITMWLTEPSALALARWLSTTFGEPDAKE